MKVRSTLALSALALAATVLAARADLVFNVTLDYDQERDHASVKSSIEDLARHLQHGVGQPVRLVLTQNAERVGERVRTGQFDVLLAPPHIVGLAMRHHYEPVARSQNKTQVVLVARPDVRVASLNEARNREVVLPHRESLVSYMVRGELNAMGTTPARHFGSVHYMQRYAAVLYAMDIGQAELAAVKGDVLREWNARGHQARIVQTLAETPQAGVAVRDQLDARTKDAIQRAFVNLPAELKTRLVRAGLASEYVHATSRDFEHVSTRGYFTPEVLPGATIVTAHQVRDLMTKGVPLYDVRPPSHYRQGHIPKSINVPYELNSPKEPDADLSVDRIDLTKLPKDKNTPLIVQCNGAECWYSYKAAAYLIKQGYTRVHWFRTGLPAWKEAGFPIEHDT
jgi:ABC-type phosphate/phosphonate transport system substrate-binding protein/rhodanese-related sulfurtransferase